MFKLTEDGTTEITSCGSRGTSEIGAALSLNPVQLVNISELSKLEKASNWLISLPPGGGSTRSNHVNTSGQQSIIEDNISKEMMRFKNSATKSSDRSKDSNRDARISSRSISYDDAKLVQSVICICINYYNLHLSS